MKLNFQKKFNAGKHFQLYLYDINKIHYYFRLCNQTFNDVEHLKKHEIQHYKVKYVIINIFKLNILSLGGIPLSILSTKFFFIRRINKKECRLKYIYLKTLLQNFEMLKNAKYEYVLNGKLKFKKED